MILGSRVHFELEVSFLTTLSLAFAKEVVLPHSPITAPSGFRLQTIPDGIRRLLSTRASVDAQFEALRADPRTGAAVARSVNSALLNTRGSPSADAKRAAAGHRLSTPVLRPVESMPWNEGIDFPVTELPTYQYLGKTWTLGHYYLRTRLSGDLSRDLANGFVYLTRDRMTSPREICDLRVELPLAPATYLVTHRLAHSSGNPSGIARLIEDGYVFSLEVWVNGTEGYTTVQPVLLTSGLGLTALVSLPSILPMTHAESPADPQWHGNSMFTLYGEWPSGSNDAREGYTPEFLFSGATLTRISG